MFLLFFFSIERIDFILLSPLEANTILLTFSVDTLCFPPLYLCRNFSIILLFFMNYLSGTEKLR